MYIKPQHIWANDTEYFNIISPDSTKIWNGWTYEDIPSYQEWNWFTNTYTQYFAHLSEQGVPLYRKGGIYLTTSLFKYKGLIYYSKCVHDSSYVTEPTWISREYGSFELLKGIQNVFIEFPEKNQVLFYRNYWYNTFVTSYPYNTISSLSNYQDYSSKYSPKDSSGSFEGTELKPYNLFLTKKGDTYSSMSLNEIVKETRKTRTFNKLKDKVQQKIKDYFNINQVQFKITKHKGKEALQIMI